MTDSGSERLRRSVATSTSEPERLARATGEIVRAARLAGIDSIVVSGGTAVILATAADFATRDIDLVTPDGDALDSVLTGLGFVRRNDFQHIWKHPDLDIAVQVAASYLPAHSSVDEVEAPGGETVAIWSPTDLVVDRLAQATVGGAPERLNQAVALLDSAGDNFDAPRAQQRAADDGLSRELDLLMEFYERTVLAGNNAELEQAQQEFWRQVDGPSAGT